MNPTTLSKAVVDHKGWLLKISFVVARVLWVLLAGLVVALLLMFTIYFWQVNTTKACFDPGCLPILEPKSLTMQIYALLYGFSFVVPAFIWVLLAIWLFLAQPKKLWSYVFSLFFLLGWYSEISVQYIRGTLPDALKFNLELLKLGGLYSSEAAAFLRGVLKLLADNLLMLLIFAFPNGKLFPKWSRFYLLVLFIFSLGYSLPFLRETNWNYSKWVFPFNGSGCASY